MQHAKVITLIGRAEKQCRLLLPQPLCFYQCKTAEGIDLSKKLICFASWFLSM